MKKIILIIFIISINSQFFGQDLLDILDNETPKTENIVNYYI